MEYNILVEKTNRRLILNCRVRRGREQYDSSSSGMIAISKKN